VARHSDEEVRARAYEIWERNGHSGDPMAHWLDAERQLNGEAKESGDLPGQWVAAIESTIGTMMQRVRSRRRRSCEKRN
jgi:Protein of unknown function (DUF2934)